jgi:predicted nuclease of restriction endonuclease-like (RecB) superfamily
LIKDPVYLGFLGLPEQDFEESELEQALIDRLRTAKGAGPGFELSYVQ